MKKYIKVFLIVIGIIVGIILLDSLQALVFDNNPIIGIQTRNMKKVGIFVDTYHFGNGKHDTVIKGFSPSSSYNGGNYILVDETKNKKDLACDDMLEGFYEDEKYSYFWSCAKNKYMIVKYKDGSKELISEALKNKHIDISVLDKFDINYIKEEKYSQDVNSDNLDNDKKVNFIKTYNVITDLKKTDQTGKYNYYVIEQYQLGEPTVIKINSKYKLQENMNYEFSFEGNKEDGKEYSIQEIFNTFEIVKIEETDKKAMEQIQEEI